MADTTTESPLAPPKASKAAKMATKKKQSPVNRVRRATFAFMTVGFSLAMMTLLALKAIANPAAMSALDGFKQVAIWIGVGYIGGSAVDYGSSAFANRLKTASGGDESDADGKVTD